jgi:hypothetical protein
MEERQELEELQRGISAMEWDIQNKQFNKKKANYYRNVIAKRDELMRILAIGTGSNNIDIEEEGDEDDKDEEKEIENGWYDEGLSERGVAEFQRGLWHVSEKGRKLLQ